MFSRDETVTSTDALVLLESILKQQNSDEKIEALNNLKKKLRIPACSDDNVEAIKALLVLAKVIAEMMELYILRKDTILSLNCYHYFHRCIDKMILCVNRGSFDEASKSEFSLVTEQLFMVTFDLEKIIDIINNQHLNTLLDTTKDMPMIAP